MHFVNKGANHYQNDSFVYLFDIALTFCICHWEEAARARGENRSYS